MRTLSRRVEEPSRRWRCALVSAACQRREPGKKRGEGRQFAIAPVRRHERAEARASAGASPRPAGPGRLPSARSAERRASAFEYCPLDQPRADGLGDQPAGLRRIDGEPRRHGADGDAVRLRPRPPRPRRRRPRPAPDRCARPSSSITRRPSPRRIIERRSAPSAASISATAAVRPAGTGVPAFFGSVCRMSVIARRSSTNAAADATAAR